MPLGKEPLLQFALGGGLLFAVWALAQRGKPETLSAGAPGAPVLSRTVVLDARTVQGLRASFRAGMKRDPQPAELGDLVQEAVGEEILFREGLARGLDRDDGVVRRRVIEKMTALVHPSASSSDPPREELRRWFETYRHRFVRPGGVTFDQLFFDFRRHGDAFADAAAALRTLEQAPAGAAPPAGLGDPFVLPPRMTDKTDQELGHLYGETFARAVGEARPGTWSGPMPARDGVLLVRVVARRPARMPEFEEVEKLVRADWLTVETRGQRAAAESLLPRYQIVLPADVREQISGAPALAPILGRTR
ncbi:MAG TPA: peptidylprolyl isomerase [Polyangia bacterium]|jgi:hypothetical protein|nr:peptidylprolyl isomerase [Polyangia bacterium]